MKIALTVISVVVLIGIGCALGLWRGQYSCDPGSFI